MEEEPTSKLISVLDLGTYLTKVCPLLLDIKDNLFNDYLNKSNNQQILEEFIKENRNTVLVIKKITQDQENYLILLELEVSFQNDNTQCIAFIKKQSEGILIDSIPLSKQLQLVDLGSGESPFETLHAYVHNTFAPFFRSYMKSHNSDGKDSRSASINVVSQKMAELEHSLYSCKQEVQIEDVELIIHPEIQKAVKFAESKGRPVKVEDLGFLSSETEFINILQSGVNIWIKNIEKVTKLERIEIMPSISSTSQEVKFWLELGNALERINNKINSPGVQLTLNTLKRAKRFHTTVAFDPSGDTIGIKAAETKVSDYKILMKDFPIDNLLTCVDIGNQIPNALNDIFSHLIKKSNSTNYPTKRFIQLLESLARDLREKLLNLLQSKRIMDISFKEFEQLIQECYKVFKAWNGSHSGPPFGFESFRDFIWNKRRQPLPIKIQLRLLEDRIDEIATFRKGHEELRSVIISSLASSSAKKEVAEAYKSVLSIDVLDLSEEGSNHWEIAKKKYAEHVDRVESQIASRLRDKLATAKNANEMFRIFGQFSALLRRPRIVGATREYQTQLLKRVKDDITILHEKFIKTYNLSEEKYMNKLHDIPETSGAIIWAQQIERQLELYKKRVEQVLGEDWSLDVEGQKLLKYLEPLKEKLNTDPLFKRWCSETESRNFEISGRLLKITKIHNKYSVDVNFDPKIITLFKEVRNLQWLGKSVPISITIHSSAAERVYPFAVSLRESLRSYSQTCLLLNETTSMLVASYKQNVQQKISEGFKLKWDYLGNEDTYVNSFAESVMILREKVDNLNEKDKQIKQELELLETCPLDKKSFSEILEKVQKIVDELNLLSYSNLETWVKTLDKQIEDMLLKRLIESNNTWFLIFSPEIYNNNNDNNNENNDKLLSNKPKLDILTHYIAIRNQVVACFPPLEHARAQWISQLNQWLGMICDLPRLRGSRYDESLSSNNNDTLFETYRDILGRLPDNALKKTYEIIEIKIKQVEEYVKVWLQYQALWDMDASLIYEKLGDDLNKWEQLLIEIQHSRKTFDTSQSNKDFGPIIIDFNQVQASISNKYDYWHKDILYHFGNKLGTAMKEGYGEISNARLELERNSLDSSSIENTVAFILRVQTYLKKIPIWEKNLTSYRTGQELLRRQRYQFPNNWLEYITIDGEWSAFKQILKRKEDTISEQLPLLQNKIVEEGKDFEKKLSEFYSDWSKGKPLAGATSFNAALESLRIFAGRLSRLQEEKIRLIDAKQALDLEPQPDDKLDSIDEEITDLQSVWNELACVWNEVDTLKDIPWATVVPRKIRKQLEDTQEKMKSLPNRMRQYAAFIHVQDTIKSYLRINIIINDLRSEALRDRHWQELRRKLGVKWVLSELTLGEVWDSDVKKHEAIYKEIITRAQGELALEEFIKQVKESWSTYELELVNYQNKTMLIKGWDDLFNKLTEHLNSISSMKASPYYKVFEENANSWDDKLNRIRNLFDIWIDVQRRWIYLEGIFSGSADIQALLPVESSRFKSINTEFVGIMKKVNRVRLIIEIVNFEGIQKTLERIADILTKIQKALGDYLERQRSAFPRFYFVGDEDLLEIIGNSKDIERIQKHLRKMFAGLASLILDESKINIIGMASREGEIVMFKRNINIKDHPKINEWLTKVENEMKFTLASLFQESLKQRIEIEKNKENNNGIINTNELLQWIQNVPTQLVVICTQTIWTQLTEIAICKLDKEPNALNDYLQELKNILNLLADQVLEDLPIDIRKKYEHLITELVHQRDVIRKLIRNNIISIKSFEWLYEMRFYFTENKDSVLKNLTIKMANAKFYYGYEYLGISEKLVQTPLTDRCYLALTQALEGRMGGSPFGPAGTGKCFAKNTPILMYNGLIKMVQDILPGDIIMGDDSTPRNVLGLGRGKEKMYKINQSYGDSYTVNESHIISLVSYSNPQIISSNNKYIVKYINSNGDNDSEQFISKIKALFFYKSLLNKYIYIDIEIRDYLKKSDKWKQNWKGYHVPVSFNSKEQLSNNNNILYPYLLGLWLNNNNFNTCKTNNDIINYIFNTKYYNNLNNNFNNNNFINNLKQYNLLNNIYIPHEYKTANEHIRLQILAGLIDGNSSLNNNNDYEIIHNNKQFIDDILYLSRSLGFIAYISDNTNNNYKIIISGNIYRIPVLTKNNINYKKNKINNNTILHVDINIEPLEEDNYYGFEIDGNHRFVLGDFTVTHNTETVKALGGQLGQFVIVFCCDEAFDFQAMSRIFVGLCQCGAWGCFDEFNRLEERILSAVSQQIQTIQVALKETSNEVEIIGRPVKINPDMGIFITMNPGYAGRSNLPDNLKQLFRGIAMISPDRELIAQVMLYSQGFKTAERLSGKIVPLFKLCKEQLSAQSHYDFGLRALKSVLVSAGNLKRKQLQIDNKDNNNSNDNSNDNTDEIISYEQDVMLRSICENIIPKLLAEDISLFKSLLSDVFPGSGAKTIQLDDLKIEIIKLTKQYGLIPGEDWIEKQLQLYSTQVLRHGVMVVGPSGSGKSSAWKILLEAMTKCDNIESVPYVVDPKAISKDELFGTLEQTTREWTDGLFTHLLRKIIDNVRGESTKRHWIIFDGDVDPEWVENLNSLLDDNRLLTLPNGERLSLPDNVRIIFEVENLKYATPATVSRCGMIWFSEETVSNDMLFKNYINRLRTIPLSEQTNNIFSSNEKEFTLTPELEIQRNAADIIHPFFEDDGFVLKCFIEGGNYEHIMDYTRLRVIDSVLSLLNKGISNVIEYNESHPDFPMPSDRFSNYVSNRIIYSCMWGFGGSMGLSDREIFSKFVHKHATTSGLPDISGPPLLDYFVDIDTGVWKAWSTNVPIIEIESDKAASPDVVIPTVDTIRHVEVLHSWLAEHKPLLLCGPPGSGKTMTLYSTLNSFSNFDVISLNFSSATTPDLILKTFEHHCEYKRTQKGTILHPKEVGKWLVIFCDEINLPENDKYGTQKVITFLRQLTEQGGYWRTSDHTWIILEKIQFVGACNPPSDPGRVPLTHRFLRYAPLLLVDFPSVPSLHQIYGTFCRALLKLLPAIRNQAQALTEAMVEVYSSSQKKFTPDMQSHYIYSPRELSRWIRALHEAIKQTNDMDLNALVRVWAHEGLRLFQDRLVEDSEKEWTDKLIDDVASKHFTGFDSSIALKRPILFSNWLTKEYVSVEREELREYVQARLKVFAEEELDVSLVVFNEVLEHILRIDRVFGQPQGHALLIGISGGGKTVLSRFVAWLNGLSIFTIKVNNNYAAEDFDEDLRYVMRKAGAQNEKICFIFDESNVLESSFLERMNTLLAGGEVPGLFEGDEYTSLMNLVKEDANRNGLMLDTDDELYKYFTKQVRLNLHIVFTMNPASPDFHNRAATSPALYNRCVLDWFGEWSEQALFQVGTEFTKRIDLDNHEYIPPTYFPEVSFSLPQPITHRTAVVSSLFFVHNTIAEANIKLVRTQGRQNYVTPRHYLDLISQFVNLLTEKREELEEQQLHLNIGLQKLRDTQEQVANLQLSLREKNKQLEEKNIQANEKLKQMVDDQQIAEQKKKDSLELQEKLKERNIIIEEKKKKAYEELALVEPTVEEAKSSVKSIKRAHLDEVRALANPPQKVRMAMEAVIILLGGGKLDWSGIRKKIMERDFIPSIINFDSDKISQRIRNVILKNYISNDDFTFESVNRASKACGPLVKWVRAQITYSKILNSVQPLRDEVSSLENKAKELQDKQDEMVVTINNLEESIAKYKEEYALLISETQAIKSEMETVKNKVERSVSLLTNLSSEQGRWEETSETFQEHMSTIVGDCLLSSAFLAYSGFFDQQYRTALMTKWQGRLLDVGIKFKQEISVVEYLSHPDERLTWQANNLPADNLCVENAIMMNRFNRYPLLIDPSGQAAEFLMKQYKERKIIQTSFLDSSFMKNLESALRFGTPLLVHDVESIDPVLNPVLNKEIRKTGGRILIRLGDQDVDFSPSFVIFLATRDPTAHFTPDLCSRVTFVNFTVTPSSLQSQCLHEVLKSERPDIEQKRSDLLKMQGEFKVRLRNLEKALLTALNESSGSILENDKVINTLTTLKNEALDITKKVEETEIVFEEITNVSAIYMGMASFCSKIFFAMEQLSSVHFLYQFSLRFFLDMFNDILHNNTNLSDIKDTTQRLEILIKDLFIVVFRRVSRTLLHEDQLTFALRMSQIRIIGSNNEFPLNELDFLMKGGENIAAAGGINEFNELSDLLSETQQRYIKELQDTLPYFKNLYINMKNNRSDWENFLKHSEAELNLPKIWEDHLIDLSGQSNKIIQLFRRLIILKSLRPDRLMMGIQYTIQEIFSEDYLQPPELDLSYVIEHESNENSPLLLASMPGHDAVGLVDDLAVKMKKQLKSIAIGSPEGFDLAEKSIHTATKSGGWVLLKNIHLAPQWLSKLEKKLHNLNPHSKFRLFMTSEIHPKLPSSLLRQSHIFSFEPPPGIKANLLHTLSSIEQTRFEQKPCERSRLYFMLAWFHAITQERLRYAPLGWSKMFEFGDVDKRCALETIDFWIESVSQDRDNINPDKIPWEAIRTLLGQSVYGGRIDNDFDQRLLDSFLHQLLNPKVYDINFSLVEFINSSTNEKDQLIAPEGSTKRDFISWVNKLPENENPAWLGLPSNSEILLLINQSKRLIIRFLKMQSIQIDDDTSSNTNNISSSSSSLNEDNKPQWAIKLLKFVNTWKDLIPKELLSLERTAKSISNPLFRFFEREVSIGQSLLKQIHHDLYTLTQVANGFQKQTNHIRSLMNSIDKALIPNSWRKYSVSESTSLSAWLVDFTKRIQQLQTIQKSKEYGLNIWMGGLFNPEAFMTATRQSAARAHSWSLENLELTCCVLESNNIPSDADETSFIVHNLILEAASWDNTEKQLSQTNDMSFKMPPVLFTWKLKSDISTSNSEYCSINIPVYLNEMRLELLFSISLNGPLNINPTVWYQRGIALLTTRPM